MKKFFAFIVIIVAAVALCFGCFIKLSNTSNRVLDMICEKVTYCLDIFSTTSKYTPDEFVEMVFQKFDVVPLGGGISGIRPKSTTTSKELEKEIVIVGMPFKHINSQAEVARLFGLTVEQINDALGKVEIVEFVESVKDIKNIKDIYYDDVFKSFAYAVHLNFYTKSQLHSGEHNIEIRLKMKDLVLQEGKYDDAIAIIGNFSGVIQIWLCKLEDGNILVKDIDP